jgi:hypothetical protein
VVTSSGIGDGLYPMDVMMDGDKIVGIRLEYLGNSDEDLLDEDEDEGDCCDECGAELESDGSCDYCEHFENSKNED